MLGKLQEHKLIRFFNVYDKDRDGFITKDEFTRVGHTLAEVRGRDMNDPRSQRHMEELEAWWNEFSQAADSDRDERVSLQEWLTSWSNFSDAVADEAMAGGTAVLDSLKESVKVTYATLDADADERVTTTELQEWATALGIEGDSAAIFERLDTDGDGVLTLDEATERLKEFYLSNDPEAPGNHIFGMLY